MKRVLFDSDVLLDVLAQRKPFVIASAQALNTVTQEQVQGYVSGHAVTNIFYILRRKIGSEAARELLPLVTTAYSSCQRNGRSNSASVAKFHDRF